MKKLQFCVSLLALTWWASTETARALPDYPAYLQTAANAPCLPHCNVCHRDDNAGSGTVDRPFALSMEHIGGLGGGGSSDVARALDVLRSQKTDSDGDGLADSDELSMGQDPNYAGDGDLCGPQVGCSTGAPFRPWAAAPIVLALLALPLLRRARARSTR